MSEQYITYGLIAKLKTKIDDYDQFQLSLFESKEEKLNINYDCCLVYYDFYKDYSYEFSIKLMCKNFIEEMTQKFKEKLKENNLEIYEDNVKIYFENYHSSSDNPIDLMTIEEFEKVS